LLKFATHIYVLLYIQSYSFQDTKLDKKPQKKPKEKPVCYLSRDDYVHLSADPEPPHLPKNNGKHIDYKAMRQEL
jgi:hypothetical protein